MKKLLHQIIGENGRFMKYVVLYCLGFSSAIILLCYFASWFGVDTDTVLTVTAGIFGFNLVSTLIIKITENKKADAKPAERKEDPNEKKTA
jgi:uncharacterized membrane protein YjjP (DUF1212 family)